MLGIRKSLSFLSIFAALLFLALPVFAQTSGAVELVGVVEAMTLDTITVNGQGIIITGAEINTALEIGALVSVEGTLNPDGSISARQVNPVAAGVQPGEAELIGVLEHFDSTAMVVNGITFDVSGAELGTGLAVGQMVKVHATWTDSGWVAREVQLYTPAEDAPGMSGEFEMTGTLEAIGDGSITVAGQTIMTAGAEIKNMLVIGVRVKVHFSLVNGVMVAREVENATADASSNSNDNMDDNSNANTNDNANSNDNDNGDDSNTNANDNQAGSPQISAQQAIDIVLAIYPNTSIVEIKLDSKFGGILVWEIKTSHGLELNIDAQTGVILTIDDHHSGDDSNFNSNNNTDDGSNFNSNSNHNDNNDDHGGRDDNHDDDHSGRNDNNDD
ncbi:MAG: PepSY domain-containing protein [Anaerolineaceae bacterium]|nr:PepSY domain-containing protein [Anaerolineaceae bacterium]